MPNIPHPKHHPRSKKEKDLILTREATDMLCYQSMDGALAFMRQQGLVPIVRGRCFLWRRDEVVALLDAKAKKEVLP